MFKTDNSLIHRLKPDAITALPEAFTYPFYYQPHSLSIAAAEEIQYYLETQTDFDHNFGLDPSKKGLKIGKMFGVMIVKTKAEELAYLAAFSGKLANSNHIQGFVPPIFDTLDETGFYKKGEVYLNTLNAKIEDLEKSEVLKQAQKYIKDLEHHNITELETFKQKIKSKKQERAAKRLKAKEELSEESYLEIQEDLNKESVYYHFRLKDLKAELKRKLENAKEEFNSLEIPLNALKAERKTLSADLQNRLHENYRFLNYNGKRKDLLDIFKATKLPQPPAGSGECAAPKLFQYAYENDLEPIAMAEFWWGISPKSQVRKHKQFYPSCRGKCEPILGFMMQGLNVEPNPIENAINYPDDLEIVYEDDYLLAVNKPTEFLSVPGKTIADSVLSRMKAYLPEAKGPLLLHRLDMSTSGLILVAKNEKTHKNLQKLFIERQISKRYVAILDGELKEKQGEIELPLRVDLNNRPRQLVCYDHGKMAKTKYKCIKIEKGRSRVHFYPITGRTHQLRVHSAHLLGLDTPILGDDLYGEISDRLYLHAERLIFEHPVFKKEITLQCEAPF